MSKSAKTTAKNKTEIRKTAPKQEAVKEAVPEYNPTEVTIKEMMIMKNVDYDEAVRILKNPTPHETGEERSLRLSKLNN